MPRRRWLALVLVLGLGCGIVLLWPSGPDGPPYAEPPPVGSAPNATSADKAGPSGPDATQQEAQLIARGRQLMKSEPDPTTMAWLKWFNGLSQQDQAAYLAAVDSKVAAPEATAAQKQAVRIRDMTDDAAHLFPGKLLTGYKPLLRMDEGVSIRPLQIETVRGTDGLVSTIWARRAKNSLVLKWDKERVLLGNVDNIKSVGGPSPEYTPPGMLFFTPDAKTIGFCQGEAAVRLPWTRNSEVLTLALAPDYRYAFGNEYGKESNTLEAIVIMDVKAKQIADIVPVPRAPTGVHCVFDTEIGYLLVLDSSWQWMLMLDLTKPNPKAGTK